MSCGGVATNHSLCEETADCPEHHVCVAGQCHSVGDGSIEPGCTDLDGDGYGIGCSRGLDCDDHDATQTGREICDGLDNDCDGTPDNGVLNACGNCEADCRGGGIGVGGEPFDLESNESEGVDVDDEGALVLNSRRTNSSIIWIANTGEGTVSRFNTITYEEEGRFLSGPDRRNDPSRTSVNSAGDVFVGNRAANTISRISSRGEDCPDTNGDGTITTSSDSSFLSWGQDDCVLWHTDLDSHLVNESHLRAVAAQDIQVLDGELKEYVWVGGYDRSKIAKLDGQTGAVLFVTESPVKPYGFALDGHGNLWISGAGSNRIGRLDTNRCLDAASCDVDICMDGGAADDSCIKQIVRTTGLPYGITVDFKQRVWIGGTQLARYDPSADIGRRWTLGNSSPFIHGIAADADGWVWGAAASNGVVRIDADDPTNSTIVAGSRGTANKGMAVDGQGKIWSISQNSHAVVIIPGDALEDADVNMDVARSIVSPYTYSDMTGLQLRLATNPRGYYRHIFEGCPDGEGTPTWDELYFDVESPFDTKVKFRVQTADSREELERARWINIAEIPSDRSPISIEEALLGAGVSSGTFLRIEISLASDRAGVSPRIRNIDVTHRCSPILG